MWRIYKEGQGKWARGLLVFVVLIGSLYAIQQLNGYLPSRPNWSVLGVDWRYLVDAPVLIGAALVSLWLFNRRGTADFLIETESELRNKVTWPSRKDEVSASIVVVATVVILGVFVFGVDQICLGIQKLLFSEE